MFVLYYPFLIEAGKVYKAIPPLYSVKEGKKKKYFTDNIDFIRYNQKSFLDKNKLLDKNKKPIVFKDMTKFFLNNIDYVYFLEKSANTYAVDPSLLELVLYHYISNNNTFKTDKLNKEVSSVYRFMKVEGNVVKGTIDSYNGIYLNDRFLNDCKDILDIMRTNTDLYLNLNGTKASIYKVMRAYESNVPSNRQRYKGLGEMDAKDLAESTLSINDRTLIRYTMDSAKEAINFIREYESDNKKILQHVGLVTRDDLLD